MSAATEAVSPLTTTTNMDDLQRYQSVVRSVQACQRLLSSSSCNNKDMEPRLTLWAQRIHDLQSTNMLQEDLAQAQSMAIQELTLSELAARRHRQAVEQVVGMLPQVAQQEAHIESFQDVIAQKVQAAVEDVNHSSIPLTQEDLYLKICQNLGVSSNNAINEDDDDDDLQVVVDASQHNGDGQKYKCPLTGSVLQDPVKSSVCGHVYSKHAVQQHLRVARHKACPVPGCHNQNLSMNQLQADVEMQILLHRYVKRQQKMEQQQQLQSQLAAVDVDGDEDDGEVEF